jgi:hypothetical protein
MVEGVANARPRRYAFALIVLITLHVPATAFACKCAEQGKDVIGFPKPELVFEGRVTSVTEELSMVRDQYAPRLREKYQKVCFSVDKVLLGNAATSLCLGTAVGNGTCGYRFRINYAYRVNARRGSDRFGALPWETSLCDDNVELDTRTMFLTLPPTVFVVAGVLVAFLILRKVHQRQRSSP